MICLLIRIESFFDYVSGVSDGVLPWVGFFKASQGRHIMGRLVGRAKAGQVGIGANVPVRLMPFLEIRSGR